MKYLCLVAWLVNAVVLQEEKIALKAVALELREIRKLIDKIAETLVNLSDKDFLKALNAAPSSFRECQVDHYRERLEAQVDIAEKEFQI